MVTNVNEKWIIGEGVAEEWEEENDSKRDRKYNENITDACFLGGPNDSTN